MVDLPRERNICIFIMHIHNDDKKILNNEKGLLLWKRYISFIAVALLKSDYNSWSIYLNKTTPK